MLKKILVIGGLIILLIVGAVFVIKRNEKKNTLSTPNNLSSSIDEPENTSISKKANTSENEEDKYHGGLNDNGGWTIDSCLINDKDVIIVPDKIAGHPVTAIGDHAFGLNKCKKIVFPDTVTYIGKGAFTTCENLEEVDLGKGLTVIETVPFNGCKKLKSVRFPESITTIEEMLFNDCSQLAEIYIPSSVTTMPEVYLFSKTTCPNAVIVTPAGSAAEQHAKKFNLPYRNK